MTRSTKTNEHGLTPNQEAFALAFFETGNAAEAYRRSYDVAETARDGWLYVEACQLLDNPKIATRLKALRQQAEDLAIYNRRMAQEEYEEARKLALKEANPSAAVSATTGKVKLFGLEAASKAKVEHTGKDGEPLQEQMDERKLAMAIAFALTKGADLPEA